jgi:N-acyl amino acid synthase of PEP-CTERM/exosortase system
VWRGKGSSVDESCCDQRAPTRATARERRNVFYYLSCVYTVEGPLTVRLQPKILDDDPLLLAQSYRLRYQVYCVERQYLSADDYPDQLEFDAFDRDSLHVGAVDDEGALIATARVIKANRDGLPLFRYCSLFPSERTLQDAASTVVEVSRVSISREYPRLRGVSVSSAAERRQRNAEPFITLLKAAYCAARRLGATHVIGATDAALHRRLVRLGFPYRVAGPTVDYYGPVAPHIMDLAELDLLVLGGQFPTLNGFPVDLGPRRWPRPAEDERHVAWHRDAELELATSRQAD